MLRLAATRDVVKVVADQRGCPTAAGDLASAILRVLNARDAPAGTYHVAGSSETTWHGFAEAIFDALAQRGLKRPTNEPIPTSAYPTPARRPMNSRLACGRFIDAFGLRLPGFEQAVPAIVAEALAAEQPSAERAAG
jgi:dTDP-4-dehydrorhamnose reductase